MTQQAISDTGLKGFLLWLKQDQPAVYKATAAKIAQTVPRGFSGFNGSLKMTRRLAAANRSMRLRGLGDCCGGLTTVGICSALASPNICIDTSCAANSGTTCSSSLTGIANIINSVTGAALSASQQASYNQILQQQLARANSGLPPLTVSSSASGIPILSGLSGLTSGGTGTLLLVGGGAVLLYLLFGKK
jgi:hypothetical protein